MNNNPKIALIAIAGGLLITSGGFNVGILSKMGKLNDEVTNKEPSKTENNNNVLESKEKYLNLISDSISNSLLCSKSYETARDLELSYTCQSTTKDYDDYTYIKQGETEATTETIVTNNFTSVENKITIKKETNYVTFEFFNNSHYIEDHYSVVSDALVYKKEEGFLKTTIKFIKNGDIFQQQFFVENIYLENDVEVYNDVDHESYNFVDEAEYASNVGSALSTLFETVVEYEMISVLILDMYADPVCVFSEDGSGTFDAVLTMPEPEGVSGLVGTTLLDYSQTTNGKEFNTDFIYRETKSGHMLDQNSHDSLKLTTQSIPYEADVSTFDDTNSLFTDFDNWGDLCVCIGQ